MNCTDLLSHLSDYFDEQTQRRICSKRSASTPTECQHCRGRPQHDPPDDRGLQGQRDLRGLRELRERLHTAIMTKCLAPVKQVASSVLDLSRQPAAPQSPHP